VGGFFIHYQNLECERADLGTARVEQAANGERLDVVRTFIGATEINVPKPEGFIDISEVWPPEVVSDMKSIAVGEVLAVMVYIEDSLLRSGGLGLPNLLDSRTFFVLAMPAAEGNLLTEALLLVQDQMNVMMRDEMSLNEMFADYQGNAGQRISELIESGDMPTGFGFTPFNLESDVHSAYTSFSYMYAEFFGERFDFGMATSGVSIVVNDYLVGAVIMSHSIHDLNWTQGVLRNWVNAVHEAN